ncbi:hypothetical protein RHGRI_010744 [Rhododendron griersonianum]|uniref:Retrotransposon gag domain-containing protein n=1 Tax=Rhododendron griersonianum TaxID=479676 RepID=A0AAV6KKH2_9ERIC|nr:hypothetical protein RHGRI_010744 [Rhododendron griersonianum]
MTDGRRIRFAKIKLVGLMWWYGLEGHIRRLELSPINTWQGMKAKLQEKFMPSHYHVKDCEQRINSRPTSNIFEECMQRLDAISTRNRVVESSRLNIVRLDTRPITKLPQPKQASVEHMHHVISKSKEVVKDTISTKLMSQETGCVPNLPKVEENHISKAENVPIFEEKDLQEVANTVAEVVRVPTQESCVPCALETNKLKQPATGSESKTPLEGNKLPLKLFDIEPDNIRMNGPKSAAQDLVAFERFSVYFN